VLLVRYCGNGKASRETIEPDGWLQTGDLASIDGDNAVFIVDRKKDMINTSGRAQDLDRQDHEKRATLFGPVMHLLPVARWSEGIGVDRFGSDCASRVADFAPCPKGAVGFYLSRQSTL
jgi:hypothetical protein